MNQHLEKDIISKLLRTKNWKALGSFLNELPVSAWNSEAHFAKGSLLAFGPKPNRDIPEAIKAIEFALILNPSNVSYQAVLSELYVQSKRFVMAMHAATLARTLATGDPLIGLTLARVAWVCGERDLAYRTFSEIMQQIPEDKSYLIPLIKILTLSLAPFWQNPCEGKRVVLTRMTFKHREFLATCRNNHNFQHHYHLFQDASPEGIARDLKETERSPFETKKITWIIELNDQPIGLASLVGIDFNNLRAEILVGVPNERSFGISLEATLLVMEFAFSTLKLTKLFSYVYSDNPMSQKNTLHLGFQQEGLLRSHVIDPVTKQSLDLFVNGCLSNDFFQNTKLMSMAKRLLGRIPDKPAKEELQLIGLARKPEELIMRIAKALANDQNCVEISRS